MFVHEHLMEDFSNIPVVVEPTPSASVDLNTATELVDCDSESSISTFSHDESCAIETSDIMRHVWRGSYLRYISHHNGERMTLFAEQRNRRTCVSVVSIRLVGILENQVRQTHEQREVVRIPQTTWHLRGFSKSFGTFFPT